jgi:hypothetical protein
MMLLQKDGGTTLVFFPGFQRGSISLKATILRSRRLWSECNHKASEATNGMQSALSRKLQRKSDILNAAYPMNLPPVQ